MFQLQLRHSFDSALPPSCHLWPFVCHWSQFLSAFGACTLNSCQRKPSEHLCSTCASSFNWAHRAVNDPMGQATASFPSGLHSTHLPLKHSWTLKRSCNNLLHFTKDLDQCFHLAPTASTPLTIPTDLLAIPKDEDTFYMFAYLFSGLWIFILFPSPLLFFFFLIVSACCRLVLFLSRKSKMLQLDKKRKYKICLKTGNIFLDVSIILCQPPVDCWDKWCSLFTYIWTT